MITNHRSRGLGDDTPAANESSSVEMVYALIDSVVAERSFYYRSRDEVRLSIAHDPTLYGLFAEMNVVGFKRAMTNLIDNAYEAVDGGGAITVVLGADVENVVVRIEDTGRGIPSDLLPTIGERGMTHGKGEKGSGLGLWSARESMRSWGGSLSVESEEGKGTKIELRFPRVKAPKVFAPEIVLDETGTVAILDDDASVHDTWNERLAAVGFPRSRIEHFDSAENLLVWWRQRGRETEKILLLVDYDLSDAKWNGLHVVEEMGIGERAILVTGYFDDLDIRKDCEALGVRLVPKPFAHYIPVRLVKGQRKRRNMRGRE